MCAFSPETHNKQQRQKNLQTKKLQLYMFALGFGLSRCITSLRTKLDSVHDSVGPKLLNADNMSIAENKI